MEPKLSVIIPIYKVEKYLRQCLDSVVNQTYRNLEIILIDDGSPDNCGAICDEYAAKDNRIIVIHKENGGVSSARNEGLRIASGKWVTFVDPDDWCELNYYEMLINSLHQNEPDIICAGGAFFEYAEHYVEKKYVFSSFDFKKENTVEWSQFPARVISATVDSPIYYKKYPGGFCWDKIYRADFIKKKEYRFDNSLHPYEDALLNFQLFDNASEISGCTFIGYHYRQTNDAAVTKRFRQNYLHTASTYLERLYDYEKNGTLHSDMICQAISQTALACCWGSLRAYFFHKANQRDQSELIKQLEQWKQSASVQRAIWSKSDLYLTKHLCVFKRVLRLPSVWAIVIYFKLIQRIRPFFGK